MVHMDKTTYMMDFALKEILKIYLNVDILNDVYKALFKRSL